MFQQKSLNNLLFNFVVLIFFFQESEAADSCSWQKVKTGINAGQMNQQNWKSLGYAINADHCGTLCMMNYPMFKPDPCGAYAFTYNVPWAGAEHNCFMYTSKVDPASFTAAGTFELYQQICSGNSTNNNLMSQDCCNQLSQKFNGTTTVPDGTLSFSYDSNTCRKSATVTCSDLKNQFQKGSMVVNQAFHILYGSVPISSQATCKNGKWQMDDPALNVETLECRLTIPIGDISVNITAPRVLLG